MTNFHKHYEAYVAAGLTDVATMLDMSRQGVDMPLFSQVGFRAETEEDRATLVQLAQEGIDGRVAVELGTCNRHLHGQAKDMIAVKRILDSAEGYQKPPEFFNMAYTIAHQLAGKNASQIPDHYSEKDLEITVRAKMLDPVAVAIVTAYEGNIKFEAQKRFERQARKCERRDRKNGGNTDFEALQRGVWNGYLSHGYRLLTQGGNHLVTQQGLNTFEDTMLKHKSTKEQFRETVQKAGIAYEQVKP